jgi:hypothetical protein
MIYRKGKRKSVLCEKDFVRVSAKKMSSVVFTKRYSLEERTAEGRKMLAKYPDRIPVIVERTAKHSGPVLDKEKYLIPFDLTFQQFAHVLRKRMKLNREQPLFLCQQHNAASFCPYARDLR